METINRIIEHVEYYKKNREYISKRNKETYTKKEHKVINKEYHRAYMRAYMFNNRPISFTRVSIKHWKLHPKFFDEKIMFNATDIKYLKKIYNPIQDRELAERAELKYKNRFNEKV